MPNTVLYESGDQINVLLEDFSAGEHAVQANQHMIIRGGEGAILDPGGHKIFNRVMSESNSLIKGGKLKYLLLSHQDPDIVAATNGWLMTTDVVAYAPSLWTRFVPHFGLDNYVADRLHGVPDEGMTLDLGGTDLKLISAHFLHSCGNFHVYDPVSRILYTGDLGASLGQSYVVVTDFDDHMQYMEGFHRRYMASKRAMNAWANMARQLDVEIIAPQHGAIFKGKEHVNRFIDWAGDFECGVDLLPEAFPIP